MDRRSMQILELDKIIAMLREKCATSMGRERADALFPRTDREEVLDLHAQTREAVELLGKETPPLSGLTDIGPEISRAGKGGTLDGVQLHRVALFLRGSMQLKRFLDAKAPPESWLFLAAQGLAELPRLEAQLRQAVDGEGNVLDSASAELRNLRRKLEAARGRLRERLDAMIKSPALQKYLQEPLVTQRNGRYCLPVKSEWRAQVPGVVHDQSASGATLFIEPMAAVELSNEITRLEKMEQAEVERILRELSQQVGSHSQELETALAAVADIDFVLARARLAVDMKATGPEIRGDNRLRLAQARHPLLPAGEAVPVTVVLGGDYNVLVITGPNTGGKTVTLRTVGLLCLMAQCGLWLPVAEGSFVPVYDNIFADIGDEQSIEQSLSTFSGHMKNIIAILAGATGNSLVLLDELGAGTDPAEGAALAIAILNQLKTTGASVLATTHYSELKAYAWTEPGVQNASMEFDVETLRPTYRLIIGAPGKSNAFEIALRLGLDRGVVERAKTLLHSDVLRTEDVLASLEAQRRQTERELARAREEREQAEALRQNYEQQLARLEQKQERLWQKAVEESNELLRRTRLQAEELLAELRAAEAQNVNIDDLARRVREGLKPLPGPGLPKVPDGSPPDPGDLKPGQSVRVLSLDKTGTFVARSGDEAIVQVGIMKVNVKFEDLRLVSAPARPEPDKVSGRVDTGIASISPQIDLRGKLVDEACLELDRYLDAALLAGLSQVHIIHGKGTGALGRGIREFLRTHSAVADFRYGSAGEGGSGVTVATIKSQ